jgi:hypothetical protein
MLAIGGIPFTDTTMDSKKWKAGQKYETRWNTVPTLTLPSGQIAGQSTALVRYLGHEVKIHGKPLTPTDRAQALLVDEILGFVAEDIWRSLVCALNLFSVRC